MLYKPMKLFLYLTLCLSIGTAMPQAGSGKDYRSYNPYLLHGNVVVHGHHNLSRKATEKKRPAPIVQRRRSDFHGSPKRRSGKRVAAILMHRRKSDHHNVSGRESTKAKKIQIAGWYMRIRVAATMQDGTVYTHNTAGVFGELRQSRNGKDRHDIPSYGPATLQVVFPHYHWGKKNSGDYWSDYRRFKRRWYRTRRVWTFLVRNQKGVDLSQADLRIFLDDARIVKRVTEHGRARYIEAGTDPKKKERFTLVDVDNHRTYRPDELSEADLNMDGKHTRTFRWVMGRVRKRDFRPVKLPE